jgi:L-histidine N-alpha-methyltransferase
MSLPASAPSPSDATPPGAGARCRVDVHADDAAFLAMLRADVRRGLGRRPRSLPPKYFYDAAGARLFERITRLPEYYLTRTEEALLARVARPVVAAVAPADIVELGPGSCRKVRWLLDALDGARDVRYVPVDFGRDGLAAAGSALVRRYPRLRVHAVVGDFETDLVHVPPPGGRRLALFLGSTIGNFHPAPRRALLTRIRDLLGGDGRLLLGVDLVKNRRTLEAAYDDAAGVTRAFNRNVLRVINRVLGADFRPAAFRHLALYNEAERRIEMHLVAEAPQTVTVAGLDMTIHLDAGEGIWTESSYKFTRESTHAMLAGAGLALETWYTDEARRFGLALARPVGP